LGIQGYEGLSFSLNGEDFQIGKSGYYTLEDSNINFVSFFSQLSIQTSNKDSS
jgi:hypothetical protein